MIQTLSLALEQQGFDTLTQVQEAVTNPELGDADLLVSAQTGSGKTVGFGLAIAPTLLGDAERFDAAGAPLALIIAPTRELALQVKRELSWLYGLTGAVLASCVGGMDMRDERRALERGAHIVVATPGRLRDHIQRGSLDMSGLRAIVLDEADEMLDLGFREDLEFILGTAPESRRTLLFSATVPRAIANLATSYQKDAIRITTAAETKQHSDIEYRALTVAPQDSENAIINVLRYYDAQNAIVFCNTRAMVNRLTARFSNRGFAVVALSGELTQNERTHALQAMRDGRARVCIATDVAARGIDLPKLELVIHAELPTNSDTLLHRSGRTGRAGRKGVSALIVPPKSRRKAESLLKFARISAEWAAPPSAEEVLARDEERMLADPAWNDPVNDSERDFIDTLTERFTLEQIAAGYLRLYRARQSAPEDLMAPGSEPAPRARNAESFGPSQWFSVSLGRNQNTEPRWLLPLLCRAGDITKDDIGAIRIQPDETFVEILTSSVPGFLAAVGPDLVLEEGATIRQLDRAPDLSRAPRPAPRRADGPRPERAPDTDRKPRAPKPAWEPAQTPPPGITAPERKPRAAKPHADKPAAGKPAHAKPAYGKPQGDKAPHAKPAWGKPQGDKPAHAKKPAFRKDDRDGAKLAWKKADRPGGSRPAGPARAPMAKASDPSQRFNPKGLPPKPGAKRTGPGDGKGFKPKGPRGGNTPPRRG